MSMSVPSTFWNRHGTPPTNLTDSQMTRIASPNKTYVRIRRARE